MQAHTPIAALAAPMVAAALLATAAVPAAAQSGVTIAGTLDLAVRQVRNGSLGSVAGMVSGANSTSKLILRGSEDLGGGLSASFFLDATIVADTGSASAPFWDRRSTVSLVHRDVGELRLGRDWVPTHLAWSALDPFVTLGVASANNFRSVFQARALGQAFGTTADANLLNPTLRVNNSVGYLLPAGAFGLRGVSGQLMVSAGENGNAGAGSVRGEGVRLAYSDGRLQAAVATYRTRNAAAGHVFADTVWTLGWNFGVARAGVGQRRFSYRSDALTQSLLAVQVPLGLGTVKLSWVRADQTGATAALSANDASQVGLGFVQALSKRSMVYAHAARLSNKGRAAFTVPGGAAATALSFGGQTSTAVEFGVRHDF